MNFHNKMNPGKRVSFRSWALGTAVMLLGATSASAMDLKEALEIALATNPEIAEAAANRRAIDFEYEQAKRLSLPSVIVEGRAGPEWVDSRTTRLLGNDEDVLFGRQASVTIQQNLFNFGRNNSERDRQASRVDAAAQRVWERSELVSLDVVQSYFDILRLRSVLDFADQNVAFHQKKVDDISRSVSGGIQSEADAQQARERYSAAVISTNETEEALEIAESTFMRLVGRGIGRATTPPSVSAQVPKTLGDALKQGRNGNPTLHIARADLDTARAEYRKAKADTKPEILLEVAGRAGDHIGGFRDTSNDVRAQVVFRHEFRGGIKSSAVQEHLNRVDETRQRLMRLERNVDSLVREAWATQTKTSVRRAELQKQVDEGTRLLDSYQREFGVGRRTLLDILDAQASLFQAQTSLVTANHADMYAQYRLLASTGQLLEVLGLAPRREANAKLRGLEKVEDTPVADTERRRYPGHFDETMGDSIAWSSGIADLKSIEIKPVTRQWTEKNGVPTNTKQVASKDMIDLVAKSKAGGTKAVITPPAIQTAEPTQDKSAKPVPVMEAKIAPQPDIVQMASLQSPDEVSVVNDTVAVPVTDVDVTELSGAVDTQEMRVDLAPESAPHAADPAPRIYGDYISSAQLEAAAQQNEAVVMLEPRLMAESQIDIVPEITVSPNPVDDTVLAVIDESPSPAKSAEEDAFPVGVPIQHVDIEKFTVLKKEENVKIFWDMEAILHDGTLYLLSS